MPPAPRARDATAVCSRHSRRGGVEAAQSCTGEVGPSSTAVSLPQPTGHVRLTGPAGRVPRPHRHTLLISSRLSAVVLCLCSLHYMSNAVAAGAHSGASCVLARQRGSAAPSRTPACCAQRRTALLSSRCAGFASQAPLESASGASHRRLRRCSRAASHAARADADGVDILAEVPQDGSGRAVRTGAGAPLVANN